MANPLEALGITDAQIEKIMASPDVLQAKIELAEEIKDYWRDHSPVDEGDYVRGIVVQVNGNHVQVAATAEHSAYLEYGTEFVDEMGLMAKTSAHYAKED